MGNVNLNTRAKVELKLRSHTVRKSILFICHYEKNRHGHTARASTDEVSIALVRSELLDSLGT